MHELIQQMRKEADTERGLAGDKEWDVIFGVARADPRYVWFALDPIAEAEDAGHHANTALNLEAAADALERMQRLLKRAGVEDLDRYERDSGIVNPNALRHENVVGSCMCGYCDGRGGESC